MKEQQTQVSGGRFLLVLFAVCVVLALLFFLVGSAGFTRSEQPDKIEVKGEWKELSPDTSGSSHDFELRSERYPGVFLRVSCFNFEEGNSVGMTFSTLDRESGGVDPYTIVTIGSNRDDVVYEKLTSALFEIVTVRSSILGYLDDLISNGFLEVRAEGKTAVFFSDRKLSTMLIGCV